MADRKLRQHLALASVLVTLVGVGCTSGDSKPAPPLEEQVATTDTAVPDRTSTTATTTTTAQVGILELQDLADAAVVGDPGAVFLAVGLKSGELLTATYGTDGDGDRVDPSMAWEGASLAKMIVATAVMQLVEQGLVDLDAPVSDYVDFEVIEEVTVRDVLRHGSGIPNLTAQFDACPSVETIELMKVAAAASTGPTEPGEYSNTNYILLGHMVERVTGTDIGEYTRDNIFLPLRMESTYWWETQVGPSPYSRRSVSEPGGSSPFSCSEIETTVGTEGHTFVTSLEDMDIFLRSLFGGEIVKPETLDKMLPEEGDEAGLGLWMTETDGSDRRVYGHFGSRDDFSAQAFYDPNTEESIVIFGTDIDTEALMWEVLGAGLDAQTGATDRVSASTASRVGESVEFNGDAFAIDDQGPVGAFYRVTKKSQAGEWTPVEGLSFSYLPAITASEDQIMVVSPGANAHWAKRCEGEAVDVAVSSDGETWQAGQLDDVWDEFLKTDSTPGGEYGAYPCMYGGGGDAVGPKGLLVVRRITICCVDPDQYPHFWFSPDGADWQRVTLTNEMLWGETSPTRWGSPTATADGFSIEVERFAEEDENSVERWESADGLSWHQTDRRSGSLPTGERAEERDSVLRLREAKQIGDNLYVLEADGVYSSQGGVLWKLDLPTEGGERTLWGESTPIVLTFHQEESEKTCGWNWPDRVETAVRAEDGEWTVVELPIPSIPESQREIGCFGVWLTSVVEESDGFRISARLEGEIDWLSMIGEVLGDGIVGMAGETLRPGMTFDDYTFVQSVYLEDGTKVRVDLREHGYGDAIVETLAFARNQLGLPVGDPYVLGEIELAWDSPDGKSWKRVD